MIRTTIKIGQHNFICDYYNNSELVDSRKTKFVMLRPFNFKNDVISISEVFLIEKSVFTDELSLDNVYPIIDEIERYSNNIDTFINTDTTVYPFYNSDNTEKIFNCDVIKVYHPITKTFNNKTIVHVYSIINNVKFHFFCKEYLNNKTCSDNEFIVNNNIYSEYIEILIPNMNELVASDTFYEEDIIPLNDDRSFIPTYTWLLDYINVERDGLTFRQYNYVQVPQHMRSFPVNITLFPFSSVEFDNYLLDTTLSLNNGSFIEYDDMTLSSKMSFSDNGKLVLYTDFNYKNKESFNSTKDAYQHYKHIQFSDYTNIEYDEYDEHEDYDINGNKLTKQYQCAYVLDLASDTNFKNIIYRSKFVEGVTLFDDVEPREFDIPIFNSWEQLPEVLVARVIFIDRYLGIILQSNFTVITKEYYKYLVRYTDKKIYMINLTDMQDKFVENVKCVIKKNTTQQSLGVQNNSPKIIYKPVFYRVQELQNIQIREGVTQNIGINLMNFLSKVETFNLNLDGKKIIESARNDSYVIFKIQANTLNTTSGTYHICNQDDEYISSGNWSVY